MVTALGRARRKAGFMDGRLLEPIVGRIGQRGGGKMKK
jgi:hypothetical protein